jgi:delta1-piperideine-2-carboxylate reductase
VVSGGENDDYLRHCEMLFETILEEEGTRLPSTRRYANRTKTPTEGVTIPKALYQEILQLGVNGDATT